MDKCNEEYHRNNEKCVCCRSKEMCDDIEKKNIKDIKEVVDVIENLRSDFDKFENCIKLNKELKIHIMNKIKLLEEII